MKAHQICLLIFIVTISLRSCQNRSDVLFSASDDEMHLIILFKEGNEFMLIPNGLNKVHGNYSLLKDTIVLNYTVTNELTILPGKLIVDKDLEKVTSVDNTHFCARISKNEIWK